MTFESILYTIIMNRAFSKRDFMTYSSPSVSSPRIHLTPVSTVTEVIGSAAPRLKTGLSDVVGLHKVKGVAGDVGGS